MRQQSQCRVIRRAINKMKKARKLLNRILNIIKLEEMRILPGQLAFFMVLALFSIFPIFGIIGSSFISNELIYAIETNLPVGISTVLKSLMNVSSSGLSIFMFVAFSIYLASTGCEAMIITSNALYKIKNTISLKQSIKAIIMTILLISLILFIVIVPAFGELIIDGIEKISPGKAVETARIIFHILNYPVSFILIFFDLKILYTIAPNAKIPSHYNNYGTLFTTILWIIITRVYAIYLNHFNTYDIFYGSMGNVVIMLFWMYLLAFVFTMGLAINSEIYFESQENVK